MSKTLAGSLAREWLAAHPEGNVHSEEFTRWCASRELDAKVAHDVRVAVIRIRAFGRMRGDL